MFKIYIGLYKIFLCLAMWWQIHIYHDENGGMKAWGIQTYSINRKKSALESNSKSKTMELLNKAKDNTTVDSQKEKMWIEWKCGKVLHLQDQGAE